MISKTDGSFWGFGLNGSGQLVDGTTTNRNTPTQSTITSLSKFSSGGENSLLLKTDGSLLAVGRNNEGQLGDGTTTNRNTPTQILSVVLIISMLIFIIHSLSRKTEAYGLWGKILMDSMVMVPLRTKYTHSDLSSGVNKL